MDNFAQFWDIHKERLILNLNDRFELVDVFEQEVDKADCCLTLDFFTLLRDLIRLLIIHLGIFLSRFLRNWLLDRIVIQFQVCLLLKSHYRL